MIEESVIEGIASNIFKIEEKRKGIATRIAKTGFKKVKEVPLEGKIAGVDGGVVSRNLHGMDLLIVRAVSAIFDFKRDKLDGVTYNPSAFPDPEVHYYVKNLESQDFGVWKSLKRLRCELTTALKTHNKFKPDYVILDGSVAPQQADKPNSKSEVFGEYLDVVKLFEEVYSKDNIFGVVEDSKGAGFIKRVINHEKLTPEEKKILEHSVDTNFLDYVLDIGERTFIFNYSEKAKDHPVLMDLPSADKIRCFYLKITKFDRPLRVEFVSQGADEKKADELASLVFKLSSHHQEYAYPAVLTEADLQAHLTHKEMDDLYYSLCCHIGEVSSLQQKRRDIRPF
jgi:hypothetical protein